MYKKFILLYCSISLTLFASDVYILKKNKQNIIDYKKEEIKENTQKLKYNWISPLNISSSYSRSSEYNDFVFDTNIRLNQDLFRFGGIVYQMSYADIKARYDLTSLAKENASLYKELFLGLLTIKNLNLTRQQTKYRLKNSDIEVFLKTQQYETGNLDITELNRALRDRNAILKSELAIKRTILDKEISLEKLTDIPLKDIDIPKFKLLSKDEYANYSYNTLQAQLNTKQADKEYAIVKSNYLPTISLNGEYGYMDNPNINRKSDYSTIGALVSIPIDYNTNATIQQSKAALMRKKTEVIDTKADELLIYKQSVSRIKNYESHNDIVKYNIELYNKLIKIIEKGLLAGLKTRYDLQTLQNTKTIDELELEINEVNIQIELVQLQFSTNLGEEYYEK